MDPDICPNCGSTRIHRVTQRIQRKRANHETKKADYTEASYYACLDCWYKWDGIYKDAGGVMPPGIEAR